MAKEQAVYFFDAGGTMMESVTYYAVDVFAVCRAAAEYADEIGAADYDFEIPETETIRIQFREVAE